MFTLVGGWGSNPRPKAYESVVAEPMTCVFAFGWPFLARYLPG